MRIPGISRAYAPIRKTLRTIFGTEEFYGGTSRYVQFEDEAASAVLNEALEKSDPFMAARFGRTELSCVVDYMHPLSWSSLADFGRGKLTHIGWRSDIEANMDVLSGFFPRSKAALAQFSELMLEDMRELDILGTWLCEEGFVDDRYPTAKKMKLKMLEPFWSSKPWTKKLEGKRVLVVHPFEASIRHQYERRELLFKNPDILPKFDLQIVKAIQSIAGEKVPYASWFDALEYLKAEISRREFDVAILGCGAYGFPLAAHVKRIGKQALHVGGASQLLFGISGTRWESMPNYAAIINEHWIRPLPEDVPRDFKKVEGGAYW